MRLRLIWAYSSASVAACIVLAVALSMGDSEPAEFLSEIPSMLAANATSPAGGKAIIQSPTGQPCTNSFQCFIKLVCRDGVCQQCQKSSECGAVNEKNTCQEVKKKGHILHACLHKNLFPNFDVSDVIIFIITLLATAMSAPAGTGGGGVLVPMYILVGQFSPHGAIPLSKATIFGGAIANNFFNLQRRHPRADRPLIDFRTTVLLEPALLLGTVLGVFFNALSPSWLITALLVVTLSFVTYRTILKGISTYKVEHDEALLHEQATDAKESSDIQAGERTPLVKKEPEDPADLEEMEEIVRREARAVYWDDVGLVTCCWLFIAAASFLKGGEGASGVAECGSVLYWFIVVLPFPVVTAFTYWQGKRLCADTERKRQLGFKFLEGDMVWDPSNVLKYPGYCFFAGFCAGGLGIAAGTVLAPIMLELGVMPVVATATSGFTVLFTASSTTMQFVVLGQLKLDYACFFALTGMLGAGFGNTFVNWLVKKYGKTYFIIFMLAIIIGGSVILMAAVGVMAQIAAVEHGKGWGFRPLCVK